MTDRDALSPRVRVVEAAYHLNRVQTELSDEDEELADLLTELCREVDTVTAMLEAARGDTSEEWCQNHQ
ncbi:hypothetical protein [Haloarcula sp. JP-L23]|uniref:hypothetical protein n=1 Tax=Haloarcula sp. JP-L23 TaxID=2716717 RepID=UPI00140EABB2|nr:hypothetical protein G9465_23610 [Haloarcula sp. JP-L23]